jgi:hypothetical protein
VTTTLGGVTLRDPDSPLEIYRVFTGVQVEAHDGTLLTDYTNEKLGWRLHWTLLTSAERGTIVTRAEVRTSQTFKPPHTSTTYTVFVKVDTLKEKPVYMGTETRYEVSFDVEEES